jgi:methylated-DNA-[protein]-cysteine S-methyltransferase
MERLNSPEDPSEGCTLFDTAIGRCGIAWNAQAITAFQLPEPSDAATLRRLGRGMPQGARAAPPAWVEGVIARIVALLDGENVDLRDVPLDWQSTPPFHRRVYELSREILAGQTRTYGELAVELGDPNASRAVGQALGANPFAVIVPCHRILAAGGRSGGFSATGGVTTKLRILLIERAQFGSEPGLF